MTIDGYRVARLSEGAHAGSWGLWSDDKRKWMDVVFTTEKEAHDLLSQMVQSRLWRGN